MDQISAYLDIETTGLSPAVNRLTVIGLFVDRGGVDEVIQMVGEEIGPGRLRALLDDVDIVYTYNGSRFDIPFIKATLGVNVTDYCDHNDLMFACWKRNLKGTSRRSRECWGSGGNCPMLMDWRL